MSYTIGNLSFSTIGAHNQNSCPLDFGLAASLIKTPLAKGLYMVNAFLKINPILIGVQAVSLAAVT